MAKSQVLLARSFSVICRNVSRTFVEHCMETPYWCTVLVHKYGRRKSTKTSGVRELVYVRINTSSSTLIRGETLFQRDSIPILVLRTVKTRKFKLSYFRNETCYGTGKMYKDLFFVYLQPSTVNKKW